MGVHGLRVLSHDATRTVVALDAAVLAEGLADLRWRPDELLAAGRQELVVDIAAVDHLSSTTVCALLLARRAATPAGGGRCCARPAGAAGRCWPAPAWRRWFGLDAGADRPA